MDRTVLKELIAWKNKKERKPLILQGARQVGKTTLVKGFGRQHFKKIHTLNFEEEETAWKLFEGSLKPQKVLKDISFHLGCAIDVKNDLLFFDEVQKGGQALTCLKYFCEELPELAVIAAGSLLGIHLHPVSFPVGKVEFIYMYPMSFMEFLAGIGDQKAVDAFHDIQSTNELSEVAHRYLWELLKIYFIVGGLPEVINTYRDKKDNLFEAMTAVRSKQQDLITAYLADVAKHSGKQNSMHIERLWVNVPNQLAGAYDGSTPKFKFKGIIPGINGYSRMAGAIDWLEKAGLIIKVPIANSGHLPFQAYTKENFFKLYLFDVGLLGALSRLAPKNILDYDYGTYKGYFAENFVVQEYVYSKKNFCSWREKTAEVEFLCEIAGKVIPVEVKSGGVTKSKSLKVFADKYHPPCRIVMSGRNLRIDMANKISMYPLYLAALYPR